MQLHMLVIDENHSSAIPKILKGVYVYECNAYKVYKIYVRSYVFWRNSGNHYTSFQPQIIWE